MTSGPHVTSAEPLPDFASPPLAEAALAVQFEPGTVTAMDAFALLTQMQGEFPGYEEQPARPPMAEEFNPQGVPQLRVELLPAPSTPRYWFVSQDRTQLIQLQHDLLAFNWRRQSGVSADYPRYPNLRERLAAVMEVLAGILRDAGDRQLSVNWCEVTYINHIRPPDGETERPHLSRVLSAVREQADDGFLPQLDDAQVALRYLIPDQDSNPRGRFTASLNSAVLLEENLPIWALVLTTRLRASGDSQEAAFEALDIAREWVVRGFAELTSEEMHQVWERQR